MKPIPVEIKTGNRKIPLKLFPEKIYGSREVGFSIPLSTSTELYVEASNAGEVLKTVEVIKHSGKDTIRDGILVLGDDNYLNFQSQSVKAWNAVRMDLSRIIGIKSLTDEVTSNHQLLKPVHLFLSDLRRTFLNLDEDKVQLKRTSGYNSYEVCRILSNGLHFFPCSLEMNVNMLALVYANPKLYSSPDMFSPPSERRPHVLRFELTQGCNYNACTFCEGYKGIPYKERSYAEFKEHYEAVMAALGEYRWRIKRLFLGGGNALNVDQQTLVNVVNFLQGKFYPRRIAIYGRADSVKSQIDLELLREAGLSLIYLGVESGSQEVLKYVNKATNLEQMLLAGNRVNSAGLDLSVMVMPGLGGLRYSQTHIDGTVEFLNRVNTRFLTFMGVNPSPASPYTRKMNREVEDKKNRPLTDREMVKQLKKILYGLNPKGQKLGMFDSSIDKVGHNPINFNVTFDYYGKQEAIAACNKYLQE